MKTFAKFLVPVAVAAIALVSCERELNTPAEFNTVQIKVRPVVESFANDDAHIAPSSKTYIDNTQTILWGTGEYMKIAVAPGTPTTENAKFATSSNESADSFNGQATAEFDFSVSGLEEASGYTYMGIYPASVAVSSNNTNVTSYKVKLPTIQNATASSYDPAAYVMVAKPQESATALTEWNAVFRRASALNKVTLTNLAADIVSVEFIAPSGHYFSGSCHFDLSSARNSESDIYSASANIYDGDNTLTVKYATALPSANDKVIWFTSWDVTIAAGEELTIVAKSASKSYTRTITARTEGIKFQEGYLNTLSVNMSSAIEADLESLAGSYALLAKKDESTYYALKAALTGTGSNTRLVSEDYTGSTTAYDGSDASLVWTIAASGTNYTIANSGKYIRWSSGNYALWDEPGESYTADKYTLSIDKNNDGTYKIYVAESTDRILAKNSSEDYFAFYTGSGYNNIVLVPIDARTPVSLEFSSALINKTTANYSEFTGQTPTATPNNSAITEHIGYTMTGDAIGSINASTGVVSLNGTIGTATVTASFAGDETYASASASYSINVASASVIYYTKVTSAPADWSGHYLIVYEAETNGYVLTGVSGDVGQYAPVTISASGIVAADYNSYDVEIAKSNSSYTMKLGDVYLAYTSTSTSSNNKLYAVADASANGTLWTLSVDDAQNVYNTSRHLRWNNTSGQYRFCCYTSGQQKISFFKLEDNRTDPGMSWSDDSATASWDNGNVASGFTAPTLNKGNASGITYQSTEESVATVNTSGVVTIVGPGTTTIKAIFAGDATYSASTASYTLTVTDNRDAVATPTFSPVAGEVEANTSVTISCATQGATIYYTVDGSAPTAESSVYSAALTIDAAKTIKAIAVKEGYKNSDVAEAAYTITGVVEPGTEDNPYSASEAIDKAATLGSSTLSGVYVKGIVSTTGSVNTQYNSVTYYISDDGTTSNQFEVYSGKYLDGANFTNDNNVKLGDCVLVCGDLKYYNSQAEFNYNSEIKSIVRVPAFASGDANFVSSTSVTLSCGTTGATIYYTNDGTTPTTSSSVYSGALAVSATTTIKAIAAKDGLVTGVISKTFTKVQAYAVTFSAPSNGTMVVTHGQTTLSTGDQVAAGETINITVTANDGYTLDQLKYNDGTDHDIATAKSFVMPAHAVTITATFKLGSTPKWNLVSSLSDIENGTYAIAALNSSKYYTVPNTTISAQTFSCTEASYSSTDGLTLPSGAGEFTFTAVSGVDNAFYIYNTNLKKYLVATGSKKFGYVDSNSSDYGYWTFSTVSSGGFSGAFSVQHSSKTQHMRAYNNSVRCYDSQSNSGVYLFIYN